MKAFLVAACFAATLLAGCSGSQAPANEVLGTNDGGSRFVSPDLQVKTGDSVTFRMGTGSHTVDFIDTDGVSKATSGNLDPGQTHVVTFSQAGTYRYFCAYHSSVGAGGERTGMVGTITVT